MTDWQRFGLYVAGGLVFGLAVALATGQWLWLAYGAGMGGVLGGAHREWRNRREQKRRDEA